MLNPFVRDSSYFQTIRNSGQLITGFIFDNEFIKLINYINNKILPTLNALAGNQIAGVLDSDGYLLRNIGNGKTQFNRLRLNDIPNGIITYNRLSKITPNSIVYGNNVNLNYISTDVQSLTVINNAAVCNFGNISAVTIANNTITNDKIALGTLDYTHLNPLASNINAAIIYGTKIQNNVLTGVNIANGSITSNKMSAALLGLRTVDPTTLTLTRRVTTGLPSDTHIIKTNMITLNSIPFNYMFGNNKVLNDANLPMGVFRFAASADISFYSVFTNGLFTRDYIAPNSFTPNNNGVAANGINKTKLSQAIINKLRIGGLV